MWSGAVLCSVLFSYSLFFSTSAGVILFSFLTRSVLVRRYISITAINKAGYKYHAKLRFIPQATLGINEGYILSITSFDSGKQIIADIAIVIALPSRYSFFTSFLL